MSEIPNYSHPQTRIHQNLQYVSATSAPRMNTLVIGPQHFLQLADGRVLPEFTFMAAGEEVAYPVSDGVYLNAASTTHAVDTTSVSVIGSDLLANTVAAPLTMTIEAETASSSVLRNDSDLAGTGSVDTDLQGRSVRVGDKVLVAPDGGISVLRTVVALIPVAIPAEVPQAVSAVNSPANDAKALLITRYSEEFEYTGAVDTTYRLEVTVGGSVGVAGTARVRVWDSAGIEPVQELTHLSTDMAIGTHGVHIRFDAALTGAALLTAGDQFYLTATAATTSTESFDGIRVDGPVSSGTGETSVSVSVFQPYTGELNASNTDGGLGEFTVTTSAWGYPADLGLSAADSGATEFCPFEDGYGTISVVYKASQLTTAQEEVITIASDADLEQTGETNMENWLGYGAAVAFAERGGTIYALRTDDDTVASFTAALKKIKSSDTYYALAVMTDNQDVMDLVAAHATEMSGPTVKNFRRCYVGTDSPGEYTVWGALTNGSYRSATLSGNQVVIVEASRSFGSFLDDASVGDFVKFNVNDTKFEIVAVLSAHEVSVSNPLSVALQASAFTLIRANTQANTARFVKERSEALANRRCVNVWCDNPMINTTNGYVTLPCKFFAAAIAGLRTALLPQQGLTMTELTTADSAPNMYNVWDVTELNDIAASGTLIVTQDGRGGPLYIRHQLTTGVVEGTLAYEDSVGVVVDAFSFAIKDDQKAFGLLGKRNVSRDTMSAARQRLLKVASDATQTTAQLREYGPLILKFFDEDGKEGAVTFKVNPNRADGFVSRVRIRVALPVNDVDNYVDVDASVEL